MQLINKTIRTSIIEKQNWKEALQNMLLMYRSTPHSTTKFTPAKLFFNRDIQTFVPNNDTEPSKFYKTVKENQHQSNSRVKQPSVFTHHKFKIGDKVLVKRGERRNKFESHYLPQVFTITSIKGTMITIRNTQGKFYARNVSFIKPYFKPKNNLSETPAEPLDSNKPVVKMYPKRQRKQTNRYKH